MARSKSSRQWLDEHFSDQFVKKAQKEGKNILFEGAQGLNYRDTK